MGNLRVSVQLYGTVVEEQVLSVRQCVRLGEAPSAKVSFPGADLAVVRVGADLTIRGRRLEEGRGIGVSLGPVRVWLEHLSPIKMPRRWLQHVDTRFLVTAALVTVTGLWVDTMESAIRTRDESGFLARQIHHWTAVGATVPGVVPKREPLKQVAAVNASGDGRTSLEPDLELVDGPAAESDDARSGYAFYEWYRASVPQDDQALEAVRSQLEWNPMDIGLREVLAHAAYEADQHEEAVRQFRWLLMRRPGDVELLKRVARAERRMGHHAREIALYQQALERHEDDPTLLAGAASALARLGRYDEAHVAIERAMLLAPERPEVLVHLALIAAAEAREDDATVILEGLLRRRERLSAEMRVELRRDIAIDPVFALLRQSSGFRAMLSRELGAAAPRPFR